MFVIEELSEVGGSPECAQPSHVSSTTTRDSLHALFCKLGDGGYFEAEDSSSLTGEQFAPSDTYYPSTTPSPEGPLPDRKSLKARMTEMNGFASFCRRRPKLNGALSGPRGKNTSVCHDGIAKSEEGARQDKIFRSLWIAQLSTMRTLTPTTYDASPTHP